MTTYDEAVRSFDHSPLAALPAYARLRQALNDLADQAGEQGVGPIALLAASQDMTATTPYADMCECCTELAWPHAVKRRGGQMTGTYRCRRGRVWTCTWAVNLPEVNG